VKLLAWQVPWRSWYTAREVPPDTLADSGCLPVGFPHASPPPFPVLRCPCSWLCNGELPGIFLEPCSPALPGLRPPRICQTCQRRQVPSQPSPLLTSGNPCDTSVSPGVACPRRRPPTDGWQGASCESLDYGRVQLVWWCRRKEYMIRLSKYHVHLHTAWGSPALGAESVEKTATQQVCGAPSVQ